nr:MAG TPA: virion protein [Bacteriophage sp.]
MSSKARRQAQTKSSSNLNRWHTVTGRSSRSCLTITGTISWITIRKMIGRWAPPKENHTEKYIQFVSDYAGIPADDPININDREQMIRIVAGMSRFENGREADMSDVIAGWNLL